MRQKPTSLALQRICSQGWRAEFTEESGGLLLRANKGWTGRANSALPLSSGFAAKRRTFADDALDSASRFYRRHGLPVRVQVPLPECAPLDDELGRRGFETSGRTRVLTGRIDRILEDASATDDAAWVEIESRAREEWLRACDDWGRGLGEAGRALVGRHPRVGFASIRDERGEIVAIGRVVVDDGWAGLSTAAVREDHRRRGLASAMIRARLRWARGRHAATDAYLQVEEDNVAPLALCQKAGFRLHHLYHYRNQPQGRTPEEYEGGRHA